MTTPRAGRSIARNTRVLRGDRGAETMEFALISPVLLLAVFGIVYALLAGAAQVSLSHATSVAVRHAAIPADMVAGTYPDDASVLAEVDGATPFFGSSSCAGGVTGDATQNAPIELSVSCQFPNPLGQAVGALMGSAPASGPFAPELVMTARAKARRE